MCMSPTQPAVSCVGAAAAVVVVQVVVGDSRDGGWLLWTKAEGAEGCDIGVRQEKRRRNRKRMSCQEVLLLGMHLDIFE